MAGGARGSRLRAPGLGPEPRIERLTAHLRLGRRDRKAPGATAGSAEVRSVCFGPEQVPTELLVSDSALNSNQRWNTLVRPLTTCRTVRNVRRGALTTAATPKRRAAVATDVRGSTAPHDVQRPTPKASAARYRSHTHCRTCHGHRQAPRTRHHSPTCPQTTQQQDFHTPYRSLKQAMHLNFSSLARSQVRGRSTTLQPYFCCDGAAPLAPSSMLLHPTPLQQCLLATSAQPGHARHVAALCRTCRLAPQSQCTVRRSN
jgi:hypothetical protein